MNDLDVFPDDLREDDRIYLGWRDGWVRVQSVEPAARGQRKVECLYRGTHRITFFYDARRTLRIRRRDEDAGGHKDKDKDRGQRAGERQVQKPSPQ